MRCVPSCVTITTDYHGLPWISLHGAWQCVGDHRGDRRAKCRWPVVLFELVEAATRAVWHLTTTQDPVNDAHIPVARVGVRTRPAEP